jgi:regulatory protein
MSLMMPLEESAEIRDYALLLLARREHSLQELQFKLERRGFDAKLVAAELRVLQEQKLQSDERFCEDYMREQIRLGYGPHQIELKLKDRGIDSELIDSFLDAMDEEFWQDRLQEVWSKKFGGKINRNRLSAQEYAKQFRFLSYRGFEAQAIHRLLRHSVNQDVMSDE